MPLEDARHPNPTLQAKLEAIYRLHRVEMDFRLDEGPFRDLLVRLGNPQDKLPPVIHVAGTNGKGSTVAMLRALAENAGFRVHAYTSPHLFRFNERLRLAGTLINDDALEAAIDYINAMNGNAGVSFFEFTSALAFHLFATTPADLCLLETGVGGRLDCSNVVRAPAVTVITPIGWDHMHILGDTLEKIAGEKAGIMKPGVPCVVATQYYPEVMPVLEARARDIGAALHHAVVTNDTPQPNLVGVHQRDNAAAALMAFALAGYAPDKKALQNVTWPGRIMDLAAAPPGWRLLYDGAHNTDSARVLADALKEEKTLTLILGIQAGKEAEAFVRHFDPTRTRILSVDLPVGQHPQTGAALYERLRNSSFTLLPPHETVVAALEHVLNDAPHTVVVTGSLYAAQLIPARYWPMMET